MRTLISIFIAVLLLGLFQFRTFGNNNYPINNEKEKNTVEKKVGVSISVTDNETPLNAENKEPDRDSSFSNISTLILLFLGLLFLLRIRYKPNL